MKEQHRPTVVEIAESKLPLNAKVYLSYERCSQSVDRTPHEQEAASFSARRVWDAILTTQEQKEVIGYKKFVESTRQNETPLFDMNDHI